MPHGWGGRRGARAGWGHGFSEKMSRFEGGCFSAQKRAWGGVARSLLSGASGLMNRRPPFAVMPFASVTPLAKTKGARAVPEPGAHFLRKSTAKNAPPAKVMPAKEKRPFLQRPCHPTPCAQPLRAGSRKTPPLEASLFFRPCPQPARAPLRPPKPCGKAALHFAAWPRPRRAPLARIFSPKN